MGKMMKYGPEATWQPPNQAFERETTFQRDYRKHSVSARQPFKPSSGPAMSDVPFDDTTAYKHEYVRYPVEPRMIKVISKQSEWKLPLLGWITYRHCRQPKLPTFLNSSNPTSWRLMRRANNNNNEREKFKPAGIPLDGLTTFRRDFRGQPGEKTSSCKPDRQAVASDTPFETSTTFKNDYRTWPTERPHQHMPDQYKKPEGDMDMSTTHKIVFKELPLQRHAATKPPQGRVIGVGRFDGDTNYKMHYQPWEIARVQPIMRLSYQPNEAPFEGMSTQKSHYIRHPIKPMHSFKPCHSAVASGRFDDRTMYRMEFTPKERGPCPAAVLNGNDSRFTFVQEDSRGHRFYQPVFTSVVDFNASSGFKPANSPRQIQPIAA